MKVSVLTAVEDHAVDARDWFESLREQMLPADRCWAISLRAARS